MYTSNLLSNENLKYKLNTSLAVPGALAHQLQHLEHLTVCLTQNGQQGLEIGQTIGYWTLRSTFDNKFF